MSESDPKRLLLRSLFLESAPDAVIIAEAHGTIFIVNAQAERLFGYTRDELVGAPIDRLVPHRFRHEHPALRRAYGESPKTREMGSGMELYGLRKDGTEFPVEISLSPLRTEEGELFVCSAIRDITARKKAEAALHAHAQAAITDDLTGLLNRRGFLIAGAQKLARAAQSGHMAVLLFVDVNDLKTINDSLGHAVGDCAIADTAALLRRTFRASDVVARLGGDEFVVMTEGTGPFEARLAGALATYNAGASPFRLSLSLGTAESEPAHPVPLHDLMARADAQMYKRKVSRPPSGATRIKLR